MLGTNDKDTDFDIVVILPKITNPAEEYVDAIFSDNQHSLYQSLKWANASAQQVGDANSRAPMIRLDFYGIQSKLLLFLS